VVGSKSLIEFLWPVPRGPFLSASMHFIRRQGGAGASCKYINTRSTSRTRKVPRSRQEFPASPSSPPSQVKMSCKSDSNIPAVPSSAHIQTASQQQAAIVDDNADELMLEAPDSPPDFERSPTQSFAGQPANAQASSSSRVNGESSSKVNFGAPGSSWQTKKFNEEYDKMESQLLDKNWERMFLTNTCIAS
jgi:hypothetical protein